MGSPAEVIDKILSFREQFGPYQRQLFGVDQGGIPEAVAHEIIELAGTDVLPVLRAETTARASIEPRPSPNPHEAPT